MLLGSKVTVGLFLICSSCFVFMGQSVVTGQSVSTRLISQVYTQPFELSGTYADGGKETCPTAYSSGMMLQQGDSLAGTLSATAPLYLAIVTTTQPTAHDCQALIRSGLFSNEGSSFRFEWTATRSDTYYVILVNVGPNEIQGMLTMYQVTQ